MISIKSVNQSRQSVLHVWVLEHQLNLLYDFLVQLLQHHLVLPPHVAPYFLQELGQDALRLEQGLVEIGLFNPEAQRVELLRWDSDGASDPKVVSVDDELEVDFAGVVDVVDDDCHDVLQFEGHVADAVADAHIGDLLHLPSHFLEEEVALFTAHLRQGIAVSIDLSVDGALGRLAAGTSVIVLGLHKTIIESQ